MLDLNNYKQVVGTAKPSRSPVFTQIEWEASGHLVKNGEEEEELLEKWKHQINFAVLKTKWLLADYRGLKKTWAFKKHWIYFWGLIRSLLNQLHTKCFALVLQWTMCTIYGVGGNKIVNNCTTVCLFTRIPYPEVNLDLLSRIEDQTLNVHFLTDSNLGPTCQAFFFFYFYEDLEKQLCMFNNYRVFAEAYCVRDTLHVDNTKLRLCSEWLQYGGLYKWLLNLTFVYEIFFYRYKKFDLFNIGFTFTATKPKEDFLTISPCCQLIMK